MIKVFRGALVVQPLASLRIVLWIDPVRFHGFYQWVEQDEVVRRRVARLWRIGFCVARTATGWRPLSDDPADHMHALFECEAPPHPQYLDEWDALRAEESGRDEEAYCRKLWMDRYRANYPESAV